MTETIQAVAPTEDWWADLDDAVMKCVACRGTAAPADVARQLQIPEAAAASLLALLVASGRLRIRLVEPAKGTEPETGPRASAAPAVRRQAA